MMFLHEDKMLFKEIITVSSEQTNINGEIIEKDYYVSLILRFLHEKNPDFVFRGGTSLSKCYKIINRFSEDIDITLLPESGSVTSGMKRLVKQEILSVIETLSLKIVNADKIFSRRDFNRYVIEYSSVYSHLMKVPHQVIIETFIGSKPYPTVIMPVSSFVEETLKEAGQMQLVQEYKLETFSMKIQDLRRTFIDKVFALCDYYLTNKIEKRSRHIYDIYQIFPKIKIDEEFKILITEVRKERKNMRSCPSAQSDINVNQTLQEIIDTEAYLKDYKEITEALLYETVPYEEAIKGLENIVMSKVFE